MKPLRWTVRALVALICASLTAWMTLAIHFSPVEPAWLRIGLSGLVPIGALAALVLVRPPGRVAVGISVTFVAVLGAWLTIAPSNDRDWQPDVATTAFAEVDGDRLTVHNVRNNLYRSETDYTVRLEDREYDLSKLRSLDLFIIYWGSPWIAHTIMSWGFEDGEQLAISIETRKERGESYSALRGFFRNYELMYVVSDERDVIGLRTNYRGEDVYVYRLRVPAQGPRLLLLAYLASLNRLHDRPQWYNALVHNCTTTIQRLARQFEQRSWLSWKLVLNGHLDELAYENGAFDQSLPLTELRERSHINARARAAGLGPEFSESIRAGLPGMATAP